MTGEPWASRFRRQMARPVDAGSLGMFRIGFGVCLFIEALRYWDKVEPYWIEPVLWFPLPGFGFLEPWPGNGMYIHYLVMAAAAVLVTLGVAYRAAILTLFLTHTYIFLLDESNYLNHYYLIALLAFLLCWMPADRWGALRLGRARTPAEPATVPFWTVFLLRAQLFIVYLFAGVAKLNPDWLRGYPMAYWIGGSSDMPVIGPLLDQPWGGIAFAWGGLLYDLSVGFLLVWRRTRLFGLAWSAMFHLVNSQLFEIGIFPWLAMVATLIFAEPDWPRRVLDRVRSWIGRAPVRAGSPATASPPSFALGFLPTTLLLTYLAVQVTLPLRHWLTPGNVAWTEEGHILSWRMKLRNKEGELRSMSVVNPRTGECVHHDPSVFLTPRQYNKMISQPRMIRHYADWIAGRYEKEWETRPQVYVDLWVSLNGREMQPLIDPSVDLAAVRPALGPAPWILPLTAPLRPVDVVIREREERERAESWARDSTSAANPGL